VASNPRRRAVVIVLRCAARVCGPDGRDEGDTAPYISYVEGVRRGRGAEAEIERWRERLLALYIIYTYNNNIIMSCVVYYSISIGKCYFCVCVCVCCITRWPIFCVSRERSSVTVVTSVVGTYIIKYNTDRMSAEHTCREVDYNTYIVTRILCIITPRQLRSQRWRIVCIWVCRVWYTDFGGFLGCFVKIKTNV